MYGILVKLIIWFDIVERLKILITIRNDILLIIIGSNVPTIRNCMKKIIIIIYNTTARSICLILIAIRVRRVVFFFQYILSFYISSILLIAAILSSGLLRGVRVPLRLLVWLGDISFLDLLERVHLEWWEGVEEWWVCSGIIITTCDAIVIGIRKWLCRRQLLGFLTHRIELRKVYGMTMESGKFMFRGIKVVARCLLR